MTDTPHSDPKRPVRTFVRRLSLVGLTGAALAAAYLNLIRPWQQHWGATANEVAAPMPGDDLVRNPLEVTTRAVTVHARPEHIWPWLAQMGNNRGGLYSYDWLDLLFHMLDQPSVNRVLPEFQNLKAGDIMPYARGTDMVVKALEPNRTLVLAYEGPQAEVAQSWRLEPVDDEHTRLIIRVRGGFPPTMRAKLLDRLIFLVIELTEFPMTRRQLLGIKERAEALAATERAQAV